MSTIITAIIISVAAIIGYVSYQFVGADNKVEETCEEVIKAESGIDVDLSKSTPEANTTVAETTTGDDIADTTEYGINANS
jgi:hypothetical protein